MHVFIILTGKEENEISRHVDYLDINVFLMCFAFDSPQSLENIKNKWMPEVQYVCPTGTANNQLLSTTFFFV